MYVFGTAVLFLILGSRRMILAIILDVLCGRVTVNGQVQGRVVFILRPRVWVQAPSHKLFTYLLPDGSTVLWKDIFQ